MVSKIARYTICKNDLFISVAGTLGIAGEVPEILDGANLTENADKLTEITCDRTFLLHILKSHIVQGVIKREATLNALPKLAIQRIKNFDLPAPPLPEQKKIASILTTVDDKISSIEHQIQQTEQLKKGLMEKLLTEGIGHTEFKETKIGRIPKGWGVERLGKYIDIKSGFGFKLAEYVDDGIPLLKIDNVSWGKITWENVSYLPFSYKETHSDLVLNENDILLALNRPITQNKLKMGILKKEDIPAILYQRVGKIIFQNELITHKFTYYLLNHILVPFIEKNAVGSDQPFINITALRKLLFQLPPLEEQKQIATILSTVDDKIEVLNQKKNQYQTLKKGLSQQLLTGQMRVKI